MIIYGCLLADQIKHPKFSLLPKALRKTPSSAEKTGHGPKGGHSAEHLHAEERPPGGHSPEHPREGDPLGSLSAEHDDRPGGRTSQEEEAGHNHLVTHILGEVDKGHVTHDDMVHWYMELKRELSRGTLSQNEFNYMISVLTNGAGGLGTSQDDVSCCMFG